MNKKCCGNYHHIDKEDICTLTLTRDQVRQLHLLVKFEYYTTLGYAVENRIKRKNTSLISLEELLKKLQD